MIHKAVRNVYSNAAVINEKEDGSLESWDKDGKVVEIDEDLVQAEVDSMQAAYGANQYQRDRESEYPSMADQLDYIYHNGIAKWKSDMVKPVKDAHPKP